MAAWIRGPKPWRAWTDHTAPADRLGYHRLRRNPLREALPPQTRRRGNRSCSNLALQAASALYGVSPMTTTSDFLNAVDLSHCSLKDIRMGFGLLGVVRRGFGVD